MASERVYVFLVQRRAGKPERIVVWDTQDISVGRASENDVVVGDPEMSRNHARFYKSESGYSVHRQGLQALRRTLVRFERWQEILADDGIPWGDTLEDRVWKAYGEALAQLGLGKLDQAETLALDLRRMEKDVKDKGIAQLHAIQWREVEGRLRVAKGDTIEGLRKLGLKARILLGRASLQSHNR